MNRSFVIIISVAAALLLVLLVSLATFQQQGKKPDSSPGQNVVPTTIPNRGGSNTGTYLRSAEDKVRTLSASTTDVPPDQLKAFTDAQSTLPFSSDSLDINFSALTGKMYIAKKNANANRDLSKFLSDRRLLDLFRTRPDLFVVVTGPIENQITQDEEAVISIIDRDEAALLVPAGTQIPLPERQQNQTESSNNLIYRLFSFQAPIPTSGPKSSFSLPGGQLPTPQVTPGTTPGPGTEPPPPVITGGDTTSIACAAGSDYGVADGYANGQLTRIRLCRVKGFVINSQVSKQFDDMTNAAQAAGMSFAASGFAGGFRTMSGQIAIYQNWCKVDGIVGSPPPYPKPPGQTIKCPGGGAPGYSNHQMGLAVDLGCNGTPIPKSYAAASQNRCFQWLVGNAGKYGFYELGKGGNRNGAGYEGWHWSVNGN